mgnify:CR=1 FL=1
MSLSQTTVRAPRTDKHHFVAHAIKMSCNSVIASTHANATALRAFRGAVVDIQRDAEGRYTEAIQFQCLERGGVRIFEGINFLTRSPQMSEAEADAMFGRAAKAGMAPYGATREQMHAVPHVGAETPPIENSWQGLWRGIGFDKLLGLIESRCGCGAGMVRRSHCLC